MVINSLLDAPVNWEAPPGFERIVDETEAVSLLVDAAGLDRREL